MAVMGVARGAAARAQVALSAHQQLSGQPVCFGVTWEMPGFVVPSTRSASNLMRLYFLKGTNVVKNSSCARAVDFCLLHGIACSLRSEESRGGNVLFSTVKFGCDGFCLG